MIIKVCGLKDAENLLELCKLNISMVGYNFYAPSPRYVDHLLPDITDKIKKAGVFVNASLDEIKEKKELYNLDYAQLHGDESVAFAKEVKFFVPVIKVFRINDQFDSAILQLYNFCDYFLFDTATDKFGGSGQKFEWKILNEWEINTPFLLSGGIGPGDVDGILKIVHPQFKGIDINSKFEVSPGIKDVEMVRNFVTEVRK